LKTTCSGFKTTFRKLQNGILKVEIDESKLQDDESKRLAGGHRIDRLMKTPIPRGSPSTLRMTKHGSKAIV
jgi:hypothetical protein